MSEANGNQPKWWRGGVTRCPCNRNQSRRTELWYNHYAKNADALTRTRQAYYEGIHGHGCILFRVRDRDPPGWSVLSKLRAARRRRATGMVGRD